MELYFPTYNYGIQDGFVEYKKEEIGRTFIFPFRNACTFAALL